MADEEETRRPVLESTADRITIDVVLDRIEEVVASRRLDAIISSDDTRLSMGGGVSAAILRLAGQTLAQEAARLVPLRVGDIAVTSAGKLPIRHVLHAVTVDWERGILPTERTVRQLSRDLLVRCEALQLPRVAVPIIGSGAARFPAGVSARLFFEALLDHLGNPTVLTDLVVSIPDPEVLEDLHRDAKALFDIAAVDMRPNVILRINQHVLETRTRVSVNRADVPSKLGALPEQRGPRFIGAAHGTPPAPGPAPATRTPPHEALPRSTPAPGRASWWPFSRGRKVPMDATIHIPSTDSSDELQYAREERKVGDQIAWALTDERLRAALRAPSASTDSRPIIGGRYVLLEELGRGGFGVVHLSWDLVLRRVVAIKRLKEEFTNAESLRKEAAIALDLNHEGIVRVLHFEPRSEQGGPFLVMEYIPWLTAEKWVADAGEGLLPMPAVLEVGMQLCRALGHAHERGVLHLDIKPGNVFVDEAAESAKLSDFGIARVVAEQGRRALQIHLAGTPAYMAPEQMFPGQRLSRATDVFQLAATLWDMLLGEPPRAENRGRTVERERRGLLDLLRGVMAPDPAARPADAFAFGNLLTEARAQI